MQTDFKVCRKNQIKIESYNSTDLRREKGQQGRFFSAFKQAAFFILILLIIQMISPVERIFAAMIH